LHAMRDNNEYIDLNYSSLIHGHRHDTVRAMDELTRTVPTVTGSVDVTHLGTTLMHEHVFVRAPELQEAFPGFMGWDDETAIADAHRRLTLIKASGVDTIVDLTAPGLGRNVRRVASAVAGTGLNVIVCTGYYTYDMLPMPFHDNGPGKLFDDPADDLLVSLFVHDIEQGIERTAIRAGILKCSTDALGVTPDVDRLLRAVAHAHLRTGVPISTHTHAPTRRGLEQQRVLREEGVNLENVIIGHCNDTTDIRYLTELIENGSYIGFDRCGSDLRVALEDQLATLVECCRLGYANRIVLSHDRHCRTDSFTEAQIERAAPHWTYSYIQNELLPQLRERGVTQGQIDQMLIANPREIFGAVPDGSSALAQTTKPIASRPACDERA
jgi:phosphotriesterase-related protein